jgi:hypothetical protein
MQMCTTGIRYGKSGVRVGDTANACGKRLEDQKEQRIFGTRPDLCSVLAGGTCIMGKCDADRRSRLGWTTTKARPHNTHLILEHYYFAFLIDFLYYFLYTRRTLPILLAALAHF